MSEPKLASHVDTPQPLGGAAASLQPDGHQPQVWETPEVIHFGRVSDLTQGAGVAAGDGIANLS